MSASVGTRFVEAIISRFFTKARGVSRQISSFFFGEEKDGEVMGSPFRHMALVAVFDTVFDDDDDDVDDDVDGVAADVATDAGDTFDEN